MTREQALESFAPGEYLRDELKARGWKQGDLATIMGIPAPVVNTIIKGKRAISLDIAKLLSAALGNSPGHWVNLQTTYDLSRSRGVDPAVIRHANVYKKYPIKEMKLRGWIKGSEDIDELESELCKFFNKSNIDDDVSLKYVARKSDDYGSTTPIQEAWLARVWMLAQGALIERSATPNNRAGGNPRDSEINVSIRNSISHRRASARSKNRRGVFVVR
jgi:HTH-type transcriptional regulator/antitoxin HigA